MRHTPEFSDDELLEASDFLRKEMDSLLLLEFLWMEMDPRLREDFTNKHPDLDKYLYDRNDDGDRP